MEIIMFRNVSWIAVYWVQLVCEIDLLWLKGVKKKKTTKN